jgi:hypothetical protein
MKTSDLRTAESKTSDPTLVDANLLLEHNQIKILRHQSWLRRDPIYNIGK